MSDRKITEVSLVSSRKVDPFFEPVKDENGIIVHLAPHLQYAKVPTKNLKNVELTDLFQKEYSYKDSKKNAMETLDKLFGTERSSSVIVYVHGYNGHQNDILVTGKSILSGSHGKRNVVVFDWESGYYSVLAYVRDSDNVRNSHHDLRWLLSILIAGFEEVDILCHSMGSVVVMEALEQMIHDITLLNIKKKANGEVILIDKIEEICRIRNVCLVESDSDLVSSFRFLTMVNNRFVQYNPKFKVFVFVHKNDHALRISSTVHLGKRRLGELIGYNSLVKASHNDEDGTVDDNGVDSRKIADNVYPIRMKRNMWGSSLPLILSPASNHFYIKESKFKKIFNNILEDKFTPDNY